MTARRLEPPNRLDVVASTASTSGVETRGHESGRGPVRAVLVPRLDHDRRTEAELDARATRLSESFAAIFGVTA